MKHPKEILLSEEAVDDLRSSIQSLDIDDSIKTIMIGLLDNHLWIQYQLNKSKMSMTHLKSHFGIKSEKHTKASSNDEEASSSEDESEGDGGDSGGTTGFKPNEQDKNSKQTASSKSKKKGHGRYPANDYTGAQVVTRTLDALYQGGPCPDTACDGRVYKKAVPGVVMYYWRLYDTSYAL